MLTTSRSLLDRLRNRHDAQAWQLWLTIYEPWLRDWLGRHRLQPADIDDLLQNVLIVDMVQEVLLELEKPPR